MADVMRASAAPGAFDAAPAALGPGEVAIVVDGRQVGGRPGEPLIEALERAGVFVPRFCYHPRMEPVGMCRVCLVELSGPRGFSLQPACYARVAEGQEVRVSSPAARKAQEGVLEFLLINHPLDCPVCDKGGECPLQDQVLSYGPGESRFLEEKRHFAKPVRIGPLVELDRERCIQCGRCTRFAAEVAGEAQIDFFGRGDHTEVFIARGHVFDSPFSGNTVQICPVGALTAPPYRFQARPWDLEQVETTCTTCSFGCRMVAQSSAGRLVRYLGVDAEPVNQSWLCDKGRYGFEAIEAAGRLRRPLLRREHGLVEVSWAEALRDAAAGIRRALEERGPDGVGVIGGARLANEDAYAWAKLAKGVIGTDNVDAQLGDGIDAELAASLPRATVEEAVAGRAVLLLCGDLREELPVLHLRLRDAVRRRGLRVVECAPVPGSARRDGAVSLVYRPGMLVETCRSLVAAEATDAGLGDAARFALGAARAALGSEGGGDGEGVVVVLGRPSLGEPASAVEQAARVVARAWPKARFLLALRRANVVGALDLGLAPGLLPGRVRLEEGRRWYATRWPRVPERRGVDASGILRLAASGDLRALVLLGADPLSDFPDTALARAAFEAVPFVVALDTQPNESTRHADVVLPVAGFAERAGTTTNVEGRVTRLAAKVVPPGVAWPDWVVAVELARRLGSDLGFVDLADIWDEIERTSPLHRGCTTHLLSSPAARDGVVLPLAATPVRIGAGPRPIDPVATPGILSVETQGAPLRAGMAAHEGAHGGRAHERVAAALDGRSDEDAGVLPPMARLDLAETTGAPGPAASPGGGARAEADGTFEPGAVVLSLVVRRALYDHGTLVRSCPSLAPLATGPSVRVRPEVLGSLGVAPESRVVLRRGGEAWEAPAVPDGSLPEGVAVVPFSCSAPEEGGVGRLLAGLVGANAGARVEVTVERARAGDDAARTGGGS